MAFKMTGWGGYQKSSGEQEPTNTNPQPFQKTRGESNQNTFSSGFKKFGPSPMTQKSQNPALPPNPVFREDNEPKVNKFNIPIERDDAITPRNFNYKEDRDEYIKDQSETYPTKDRDYYDKNRTKENIKSRSTYVDDTLGGWVDKDQGRYAEGYGGHTEKRKLDLAKKGYRDIDVSMEGRTRKEEFRTNEDGKESGVIARSIDTSREGLKGSRGRSAEKSWMKNWDSRAAKTVDPGGSGINRKYEMGDDPMSREGFTDLEKARISKTSARGRGITRLGSEGGLISGRKKLKGQTAHYVDKASGEGPKIESYVEGRNIAKKTQRDKGTLDIRRDKVKDTKRGNIRKTGEGFLGLQNRKKYIDGVLQKKNTIYKNRGKNKN